MKSWQIGGMVGGVGGVLISQVLLAREKARRKILKLLGAASLAPILPPGWSDAIRRSGKLTNVRERVHQPFFDTSQEEYSEQIAKLTYASAFERDVQ